MNSDKKKVSVSNLILFALEKFVEGGEIVVESSRDLKHWMYAVYNDEPMSFEDHTLSQAIRRLRLRGLLEREKKDVDKIIFRLTEKGRDFVFLAKVDESNWDGKWRIVIFDIPESKRLIRDVFRYKLKSWGFEKWQKSVWATKRDLAEKLRVFVDELGISDWVLVIESENIGNKFK